VTRAKRAGQARAQGKRAGSRTDRDRRSAAAPTGSRTELRLLTLAVAAAVAFGVLARGGFFPSGKTGFAGLAALALLAAWALDEDAVRRELRAPPVLVIGGIAVLSLLSVAWTLGDGAAAARAAAVAAGYGALAVAAAVLAGRRGGVARIALIVAGVATAAGALGLLGVVLREEPLALRLGGAWRAGGSFEYPPALALLSASALPFMLREMVVAPTRRALPAASAAALAGGVLALSESRTGIALAAALLAAAVLWPAHTVRGTRAAAAGAAALVVAAGTLLELAIGGPTPSTATGADGGRALVAIAMLALAPLVWWSMRKVIAHGGDPGRVRQPNSQVVVAATLAACVALVVVLAVTVRPAESGATERLGNLTHSRGDVWDAAVQTALDHPVAGVGAEGFLAGSIEHQPHDAATRYAHSLPLELWAELGPLGLLLALALYATAGIALVRSVPSRQAWLVGPGVAAFLIASLLDWPWHLAGAGAVFAACLGGVLAITREESVAKSGGRV
jgi:O-antigen ligase/polysaccharide polymerase Wzy-like membrane protein